MLRTIFAVLALLVVSGSTSFAADWWVRPAGGDYVDENGTSYENAWDGLTRVVWGPGGVEPGDTLWVSGIHIYRMTIYGNITTQAAINVISGTGESTRITIRGDASSMNSSYEDGIVWGAYLDSIMGDWTPTAGRPGVYEYQFRMKQYGDWYFEVNELNVDHFTVLEKKQSIDDVENTPGSFYAADFNTFSTLYVHKLDNGDPTGRILFKKYGYQFRVFSNSYITFKNLTFYAPRPFWIGGDRPTHIRIEGNKFFYGEYWMFGVFDGMDYIEILDNEIAWAGNGIYNVSQTNNAPSYYNYSRNYFHDIGVRASSRNSDAHAIGIQGGHDGIIDGNIIENSGSGPLLYSFLNQELKNTLVTRNYIKNLHTIAGANAYGIGTQMDNLGHADKSGNKFYYNIVDGASTCYRFKFEDEQEFYNNIAINCLIGLSATRTTNLMIFENSVSNLSRKQVVVGVDSGNGGKVASVRQSGTSPDIAGSFTYTPMYKLNFISGGPAELLVGWDFVGATSSVLNTARYIHLTSASGSWAAGDAEGEIYFDKAGGSFEDNENFDQVGGQANIFTMVGNFSRTKLQDGENFTVNGVVTGRISDVTQIGPWVKSRNNIFLYNQRHVAFGTAGERSMYDADYNLYFPDGPEMFSLSYIGTTNLEGMQSGSRLSWILDPNSRIADPLFENLTSNYSASSDFKLTRNSPGIDAGEDVSSDMGLTLDQVKDFTNLNSIVHLTDIGAHEYPYSTVPPTADAGPDQTVDEGDMVTLDATGSSDAIDDIASYLWSYVGPITLPNLDSPTPSYQAPEVGPGSETFTFQVVVTDKGGLTDTDTVTITVRDVPVTNGGDDNGGDGGGGRGTVITTGPSCFISSVF